MRRFAMFVAASLAIGLASPALAACPVGEYDATGWNPGAISDGPPSYRASVVIRERGANVCTIDWTLGRQTFSGVGFYDEETGQLNASYANVQEGWFGIISYRRAGNRWEGDWAIYNTGTGDRGHEILVRR